MLAAVIVGVLIFVLVFAIAAGAIGRETFRLDSAAPAPSFELVAAVDAIAEGLPPEVSAQLSYEDVRDLVTWHLEALAEHGYEQRIGGSDELLVVEDTPTVDSLVRRAAASGRDFDPAHVKAVLDGELEYLQSIGAVGPVADPDTGL